MQYLTAGSIQGSSFDLYTYTKETNKASSRNSLLLTWDMISTISIDQSFCSRNSVSTRIQSFLHIIPILKNTSDWKSCRNTRSATYSWLKCSLHILLCWDVTHFIQISSQRETHCKEVPSNQGFFTIQTKAINPSKDAHSWTDSSRLLWICSEFCSLWPWQSPAISSDRSPCPTRSSNQKYK